MEETLVLIKPDAVERRLIGSIIHEYERNGLEVVALRMVQASEDMTKAHYADLANRDFFDHLIASLTRCPLVAIILKGEDAIAKARAINGATDPDEAQANTIRAIYGLSSSQNAVHASDSLQSYQKERTIWFDQ